MKNLYLLLIFLTGCTLAPKYTPPEALFSDSWETKADANEPIEKWWEVFHDDLLNKYIQLAKENNYNVQVALANILQARALKQIAASNLYPQAVLDVNGTKTYFSKNGPVFAIGPAAGNPAVTTSSTTGLPYTIQIPQVQNLYNALLDASWELDLFGRTQSAVNAATAELESRIDQKNDVLITAYAEVALNYIALRSFQEQAHLLEKNIALYEQNVEIVKTNLKYGYANQIDLETSEAQLANAKAQLPNACSEIYSAIYNLSILIGKPPETLVDELLSPRPLPLPPQVVAVGLRSDLLRRRPDIRSAERKLAEATANIGVAVASFFPTVTLLANGGFQSLLLPTLFNWGSKTWAYGADINMPIFEGGKLFGNLYLSRAEETQAAANYQQTVLSALQNAETSLKQFQENTKATSDYEQDVLHTQNVVTITRERFNKGLIDLPTLLSSEETLISSTLTLLNSKTAQLFSLISLYKSLGGGWESSD